MVTISDLNKYLQRTDDEMRLRNYSPKTKSAYLRCLKEFLSAQKTLLNTPDRKTIADFLLEKESQKKSPQTINLYLNAIKFFYRDVLKSHERIDLKFAKRSKKLPVGKRRLGRVLP